MPIKNKKVQIETKGEGIVVYIKGLVHLYIKEEVVGFQSWIDGYENQVYRIQFYSANKEYNVEYDKIELWTEMLKQLNEKIIKP